MKIEIIPAIDLMDGKCVRLSQGDYGRKTIYADDPLDVAKQLEQCGLTRLHLVDLDGAKAQHIVNHKTLERIATRTGLSIDFGGGLKSDKDLEIAFECGAQMVTGGSIAVKEPETFEAWINRFGADKIILGADAKDRKIAVGGWLENTALDLMPFLQRYRAKGITQVICTDISKDGMLQGPALNLYKDILQQFPGLHLVASGGVGSRQDILDLAEAGVPAVIVGKAIYEGKIPLHDLARLVQEG